MAWPGHKDDTHSSSFLWPRNKDDVYNSRFLLPLNDPEKISMAPSARLTREKWSFFQLESPVVTMGALGHSRPSRLCEAPVRMKLTTSTQGYTPQ